jgi:hypothetical protein
VCVSRVVRWCCFVAYAVMRCVRVCAHACVLTSLKPTPRKRWPAFEARNRNPHSCSVGSCYPPAANSPATRAVDSLNVIALELFDCRECSGGTNALCVIPTVSMEIVSQSVGRRDQAHLPFVFHAGCTPHVQNSCELAKTFGHVACLRLVFHEWRTCKTVYIPSNVLVIVSN